MQKYDNKGDIRNLKELIYFQDILNTLPDKITKKNPKTYLTDDIAVILSADDNYAKFVAVTGVSILANTDSHISFYVISDGISPINQEKIEKSYRLISDNFALKFIACDSRKEFADKIKVDNNSHVALNTCNRLLFSTLCPEVKKAIYLDVDLIVLGDLAELWNTDMGNNFLAAVPMYVEQQSSVKASRSWAKIPDDSKYDYFNAGVLMIDYDKWREAEGGNTQIIDHIFKVIEQVNTDFARDEVILNRLAYEYGGYKRLKPQFNVYFRPFYLELSKRSKPSKWESHVTHEMNSHIDDCGYRQKVTDPSPTAIRHFVGPCKPWNAIGFYPFNIRIVENVRDFWSMAHNTLFFDEIKEMFFEAKLKHEHTEIDDKNIVRATKNFILYALSFGTAKKFLKKFGDHMSAIFS